MLQTIYHLFPHSLTTWLYNYYLSDEKDFWVDWDNPLWVDSRWKEKLSRIIENDAKIAFLGHLKLKGMSIPATTWPSFLSFFLIILKNL